MSTIISRSALLLALTISASVPALETARAQEAQDAANSGDVEQVVVVGSGETHTVSTLLASSLEVLPPGTSVQKSLNSLPGVMAQSIDALGLNEQSMTLQVRGFATSHLGYTLDGMPLGDGSYNNYNGLSISRALTSENLGRADLATGIAGLSIASTSNLGGAVTYTSSDPHESMGLTGNQSVGSKDGERTFLRFDTGEYDGFSAYVSGQYGQQHLFVDQSAYNMSSDKQFNGKAQYNFGRGVITAYVDVSDTNQADDLYISKDMISRLGYDIGGYAPDWTDFVNSSYCSVTDPGATPSFASRCVAPAAPAKTSDARSFTNGQIIRDDAMGYIVGDYDLTDNLKAHLQAYHHDDKGDGNNWIAGLSIQGTATTADDTPVQIRDTRYTINRNGILGNLGWDLGFNHLQGGLWFEENVSSAARYLWTNVTGPFDLAQYLGGQPSTSQWAQKTNWNTRQYYLEDKVKLLDDTLNFDFGFKGTDAKSDALAIPGIAAVSANTLSTQFATGSLTAKDDFLPEAGMSWKFAPGHELYASYAANMAMFQGGFKLGPQSVSQSVWNAQGSSLQPEKSKSFDGGYRYVTDDLQLSLALYDVDFRNRLLQYNPCPTALQQNPGCGNSFHNAGSVTSKGTELGAQWEPLSWFTWYNSVSLDQTTYNSDLNWCTTTCVIYDTAGKQQVDTPKQMYASVLTVNQDGFWASLQGKFTGKRYYTYTNDQGFDGYTTFDLGLGYDFGKLGVLDDAKLSLNVTNLTNVHYISNFDNSVFAPTDPTGTIIVAHTAAPQQFFITLGASL